MSNIQVTIPELENLARVALRSAKRKPLGLIGMVGIAKTQWIKTRYRELYAEHLGLSVDKVGLIQTRVANRDAAELAGVALPVKDPDGTVRTQFTKPPYIQEIWAAHDAGFEYGISLIDEFGQAGQDVQKVFADLFDPDERTIAGWPIPDGWIIAWTGNRTIDKSGANRVLAHVGNRSRVAEIPLNEPTVMYWTDVWAPANDVHPLIIDCTKVHATDGFLADKVPTDDGQICTLRSLTHASADLVAFTESPEFTGVQSVDSDGKLRTIPLYVEKLLATSIGPASAAVLRIHIEEVAANVPTVGDILSDPRGVAVPDSSGMQSIAGNRAIAGAQDADGGEAALIYITRLRADLQVSLGSKLLRASVHNGWTLTSDVAVKFIEKFHDLLPLARDAGMTGV